MKFEELNLTEIEKEKINTYYSKKYSNFTDAAIKAAANAVISNDSLAVAWFMDFFKGLMLTTIDRIKPNDTTVKDNICGWPVSNNN